MDKPVLNFNSGSMPRQWKKAIQLADRIVAFSPYITDSATTEALRSKGSACELYTVVTLEVYASGASKVGCLKRLVNAGVKVFHLENLHAKILLIPGKSVTIGSQNMTAGGSANLESTIISRDPKDAAVTEKETAKWRAAGKLVTTELIESLERAIRILQPQHKAWKAKVKQSTEEIWTKWHEEEDRKEAERQEKLSIERTQKYLAETNNVLYSTERHPVDRYPGKVVRGRLVFGSGGWSLVNYPRYQGHASTFCEWLIGQDTYRFTSTSWRPCFDWDSRQWGRARVCKERISFIERRLRDKLTIERENGNASLEISCPKNTKTMYPNLEIKVRVARDRALLLGRYDIDKLTIDEIRSLTPSESFKTEEVQSLVDEINGHASVARQSILDHILRSPGEFRMGASNRVDQFFQPGQTVFTRLHVVGKSTLLLFSNSP